MLTENNKPGNYVGNNNNDFTNNNFIKEFYDTPEYWTHTYGKLNLTMVDGSVSFLNMQQTYYGLRDATSDGNQVGTCGTATSDSRATKLDNVSLKIAMLKILRKLSTAMPLQRINLTILGTPSTSLHLQN